MPRARKPVNPPNLSELTDEHLADLIRLALQEAGRRGLAVDATESARLSEAAKAQIATQAAQEQAERLRAQDAEEIARDAARKVRLEADAEKAKSARTAREQLQEYKAEIDRRIGKILRPDRQFSIQTWSRGSDLRLYINHLDYNNDRITDVTYYHTGNAREQPETLVVGGDAALALDCETTTDDDLRDLCREICVRYPDFSHTTAKTGSDFPASWPCHWRIVDPSSFSRRHLSCLSCCGQGWSGPDKHNAFATREEADAALASYLDRNPVIPNARVMRFAGDPE